MRSLITCLFGFIFFNSAMAQTCAGYYFFSKGDVEMITYDDKGKEIGTLTYYISEITKTGNDLIASFTTEEKVVDAGPLEINKKEDKTIGWPVYAGGIAVAAGVIILVAARKKA